MSFITQSSIQELIDKIDAIAIVGDYVRLENRSGRYVGLCPFHHEKTPSFSVNPERKLYYCFGCGKGGTVISLVMEMEKSTFPEIVEQLAKRFGVELVYDHTGTEKKEDTRLAEILDLYRRVTGSFYALLTEKSAGIDALNYLLDRGISRDMINRFQLGFAPIDRYWLYKFLLNKGYSKEFLALSGLFSKNYPEISFFSNRIMFPIANRHGQIIAFGGRILGVGEPKYLNSSDSGWYKKGQTLFALDHALANIRSTKEAILAEGYMDVIALHQAGITNAVAPLGTSFTDDQARLLRRWAERVYVYFDSDSAGKNATVKALLTCRRNVLDSAAITPDKELKDPAEILQKFGGDHLTKSIKCYIIEFDYLISYAQLLYPKDKARAVAFLFPYLDALDSDVSRDASFDKIADTFGVDRLAVRTDYRRFKGDTRIVNNPRQQDRSDDDLSLLIAVAVNYDWYSQFRALVSIKDVDNPIAKEIFIALEECFKYDEAGLDALLARISSEKVRELIIKRGASKEFSINPELYITDGIKKLKQKQLVRRRDEIMRELNATQNETSSNGMYLENLVAEKMHIDAELYRLSN
jgi:DNA primase